LGTVFSFNDWSDNHLIFGMTVFDFVDFLTAQIMLPLGGVFIAVFAGWCMHRKHVREEMSHESREVFELWRAAVRYISPALVLLVFFVSLWEKLVA